MAFSCVLGRKAECDGCGGCTEVRQAGICACCGQEIYEGEDVYDIDGEVIHEDCLREHMRPFLRTAEIPETW